MNQGYTEPPTRKVRRAPISIDSCGVSAASSLNGAGGLADSPRLNGAGGNATTGGTKMSILRSLRPTPRDANDVEGAPMGAADLPLEGFERLNDHEVVSELSKHSQVELEEIETFERSHQDRPVVLDKLRYLRGPEPLSDYDSLSAEAIGAEIGEIDVATLRRIRVYERKFQHRPSVLDPVADALRERRPASVHRV